MKLFMVLACAFLMLPGFLSAQEDKANLYEVVRLKVKKGQEKAFEAAVKAHNAEHHGEGMYRARLRYNINGPYAFTYSWVMGPTNYAAMDNRPDSDAHNADWEKVREFIEEAYAPEYWSFSSKLSHTIENDPADRDLIWVYDIKAGEFDRFAELVAKVKKVYQEKIPNESFIVCWNDFADTKKGHDAAILFGMKSWAEMDIDRDFGKLYEEVHGANTWGNFLNDFRATVNGRVDWLRQDVN